MQEHSWKNNKCKENQLKILFENKQHFISDPHVFVSIGSRWEDETPSSGLVISRLPVRRQWQQYSTREPFPAVLKRHSSILNASGFHYTSNTALMQPSFSGLFVTWAYLPETHQHISFFTLKHIFKYCIDGKTKSQSDSPQMTFPPCVTNPSSLTLTSMTVPLVMTPSVVYSVEEGFFFTPRMGKQNVAFSSGWVTCAFLNLRPWRHLQSQLP